MAEASLKSDTSLGRICVWRTVARTLGHAAPAVFSRGGKLTKNVMGRPRKKRPEEMTELERLRYENDCLRVENALLKKVKVLVEEREARLGETGLKPSMN